jgi:AcrR family transcriptional regulator
MRAIAKEAGVATGNAYYYFGSKEELIHAYYARNHAEHAAACRAILDTETRLDRRIAGVLRARSTCMRRTTRSPRNCTSTRPSRPAR